MSEDELLVDVSDGIGTVTFHRPRVRNALTGSLVTAVRQALADLDADPDVAVIVLTGTDPAFCAGLDLKALAAGDPVLVGAATEPSSPPWTPTVKPVIGAVNGPCVAGGLEFALACDLLVASERATFADTHTRVGVMPGVGADGPPADGGGSPPGHLDEPDRYPARRGDGPPGRAGGRGRRARPAAPPCP